MLDAVFELASELPSLRSLAISHQELLVLSFQSLSGSTNFAIALSLACGWEVVVAVKVDDVVLNSLSS
ncbi:hypothetical protein Tco_1016036 [Tanacetum coccineum]|uniref:Uncharacterized protein n=1 Tax=Tanacetum coccineum TaxID=301880 RepID=A0ABQ5FMH8_9ASTR